MVMTAAQQLIQEGWAEGREEGWAEGDKYGFERGIVTGRKMLLTMLERRFKSIPLSVRENIESIHDDVYLQSLFIEAMECQTLDKFCESLL